MNRRDFLKTTAAISLLSGTGFKSTPVRSSTITSRTLVNIMLPGGADFRYLFAPSPGTEYADKFWNARKPLYQYTSEDRSKYIIYQDVWNDLYTPVNYNGITFGIHKYAGWLKTQFELGNVAVICNVIGSDNRRHDHSQLILNTGDHDTSQFNTARDGWGGRLVAAGDCNVISVSSAIPIFCNSPFNYNLTENVIHAKDTRNFTLPDVTSDPDSEQSILARALKDYYQRRGLEIEQLIASGELPEYWPYRRFFQHEKTLRFFGDSFQNRLDEAGSQPLPLVNLYSGTNTLNDTGFGFQCANIYDCMLASDILNVGAIYAEYTGWDTHHDMKPQVESRFSDLFGELGGLSVLTSELSNIPSNTNDLVYMFNTDFGRQLAANGGAGTDHGRGNYTILIGSSVNGGIYGEMFPLSEITPSVDNSIPYETPGADIVGRTSFERVYSQVCDWQTPGTGKVVFPNATKRIIESDVNLGSLLMT